MTTKPKPISHVALDDLSHEDANLTLRCLEQLGDNLAGQGYEGPATVVRQFAIALAEQTLNAMEEQHEQSQS